MLDVVYNHVGASGNEALAAFGPYFTDRYSTSWGEAINFDDARRRRRARVGAPERRGLGRATSTSTACGSTRSTRSSTRARATSSQELTERVHAAPRRRAGDRRERPERPQGRRAGRARRLRLRRPVGRRLPPRAARAAHRRARRLLRGLRRGRPSSPRRSAARRPRRDLERAPRPRLRRAGRRDRRPSASSSSPRTTTRSATARSATGCPPSAARSPRSCVLLSPFVPMLFMGEEYGERRAVPVLHRPHRRGHRRRHARGPAPRVRRASPSFAGRGRARPAGPGDVRALEADAARGDPGCASSTRGCCALRARARPGRGRRRRAATRRRAGCACGAPASSWSCNFARERAARAGRAARELVFATHEGVRIAGRRGRVCPPLAGAVLR